VRNCKILARNFKGRKGGEVDIVAREGRQLLFIEVKTRKKDAKVRGLAAVNRKKRSLIERGANEWLRRLGTRQVPWRFDVIEVEVSEGEKPTVKRIENVFGNSSAPAKW
jgi:putative endonuclease